MPLPIFALFLAAFGIGTAEFVIAGLLPDVSTDLGVSIPTAGFLISAYALGVAAGGPIVTLALARVSRKAALLGLVGVFTAGQVLCAIAPDYWLLLGARMLVSIGHGAYFGVAAITATRIVGPDKAGRAIALLLAGITVANIIGVPAGTAIGNALGWRATFWAVGVLGLIALCAVALFVPASKPETRAAASLGNEIRVLGRPAIWMTFLVIIVAMVGQFSLFSYIAPFLTDVTKVPLEYVPWLLLLFGVGSTVGVLVGGRLADWKLMPSLIGMLLAVAATYAVLWAFGGNTIVVGIAILAWAGLSFGFGAPAQTRILKTAADAPNLASPLVPTAFNIGIALGAWAGGSAIDAGWGYASLPAIGVVVSVAAAGLAAVSWGMDRRAA
jgi:DHA1 family inner membrane transport protein